MIAMLTMVVAFLDGLRAVLSPTSILTWITILTLFASILIFMTLTPISMQMSSPKKDKSYYPNVKLTNYIIHFLVFVGLYFLAFNFVGF